MKRYKQTASAVLLSAFMVFQTGCAGSSGNSDTETQQVSETEAPPAQIRFPLTLRAGYSTDESDPRGVVLEKFRRTVGERTGGDIIIEIHPSSELGSDAEMIAGLISGDVDMTVSSAGNYAAYATKIGVSALPFLFDDFDSAWEFIDSPVMEGIEPDLEKYNMHILAYFDNGFRCVTTSAKKGAIKSVRDMRGLNIRTSENIIVMETMSALSANPKSYPFSELKGALAEEKFDAQENPVPVIYNSRLYEVQKYLAVTNHSYDAMPLTIRQDIWKGLPQEYRDIISEAAKTAEAEDRAMVKQQTEEYVELLEKEGMTVTYPDTEPFREATADVIDFFSDIYGAELTAYMHSYYDKAG